MGQKIVTVFGSSRLQRGDADYEEARNLGRVLAQHGFAVCTGGYGGVMEAASQGAKEAAGKTYGVTAGFFTRSANEWVDVEVRKKTWEERLFELIELGDAFVACKGGTGTLVELAVVWEMLNKSVMSAKPLVVLGDFWPPILERVRDVELASASSHGWAEANGKLVHSANGVEEAVEFLVARLESGKARRENRK
jgi:uncharacterized protein (TIGR00725 family)